MKIAVLFPGQGSQFIGMGTEFVAENENCTKVLKAGEEASSLPLGSLCSDGPMEVLTRSANLQPAITVTNLICWEAFRTAVAGKAEISCFAGHSLGEYSALCAAGVISTADAIRLVAKRGALMEREGDKNPGGMRAVVGLGITDVERVLDSYTGTGVLTAANHNTPVQVVISGSMEALDGVTGPLEEAGAKVIPLNVSVANHSPLVADAVPDFAEFLKDIPFASPSTPVYFNVSGQKETEPLIMKDMMARQIASRVRWCEIIESMLDDGVDTFIEVGPKPVLKGMMRKIVPKGIKVGTMQFDSPDGLKKCLTSIGL